MKINILTTLLICIFCIDVFAQTDGDQIIVGRNFTLKSEALKEDRQIQVFLPDGYETSEKKYPVLYVLDGQLFFLHSVSLQNSFVQYEETPEFIVVGITNKRSERTRNFSVRAKEYSDFIEKDIIAFVDRTFRTSKKRMIFGWAYGGSFAVQMMIEKPKLFNVYLAASPFPLTNRLDQIDQFLAQNKTIDNSFYFTSGVDEGTVSEGTNELNKLLQNKAPKNLDWAFREINGETHRSTPYATIYHGIKKYFSNYPELQFDSLDEFKNAGGMKYVQDYQKRRAEEFGFPTELSQWTKFTLTRNAIRADDYKQFEKFLAEFKGLEFIGELSLNRAVSIADFYVENKGYDNAIEIYTFLSQKHPRSELPFQKLGDLFSMLEKKTKAEKFYKKARDLSENNSN